MKLSCSIMAHPIREESVADLTSRLDRPVTVAWDTVATPSRDPGQRWATGRRAWLAYEADADWHLVLQDDAVVGPDFLAGMERVLDAMPGGGICSPYLGTRRPVQATFQRLIAKARETGASWIQAYSLCWGVAIAAPTATIEDMLRWGDKQHTSYDTRVGQYFRIVLGWPTWHPWPSLVDHRDGESLVGHGRGRRAHEWYAESALTLPLNDIVAYDRRATRLRPRGEDRTRKESGEMAGSYAELRRRVEALEQLSGRIDTLEAENARLKREVSTLKGQVTRARPKAEEDDSEKES